jgi:hypothetical protein
MTDRNERLRTGLAAIYAWFERNAARLACVLRDAEHHALTREISAMRFGPRMHAYREVLGADLSPAQQAILVLALSFFTWRTLTGDGGLDRAAAAALMAEAIARMR